MGFVSKIKGVIPCRRVLFKRLVVSSGALLRAQEFTTTESRDKWFCIAIYGLTAVAVVARSNFVWCKVRPTIY